MSILFGMVDDVDTIMKRRIEIGKPLSLNQMKLIIESKDTVKPIPLRFDSTFESDGKEIKVYKHIDTNENIYSTDLVDDKDMSIYQLKCYVEYYTIENSKNITTVKTPSYATPNMKALQELADVGNIFYDIYSAAQSLKLQKFIRFGMLYQSVNKTSCAYRQSTGNITKYLDASGIFYIVDVMPYLVFKNYEAAEEFLDTLKSTFKVEGF